MAKDFSKNLIKDYKYWSVYAHENQGYLGSQMKALVHFIKKLQVIL
jgi:hypothetical protein